MEIVSWGGWLRCARLVSGETEMIVTLEVGPRVVRYGLIGGPNELRENPAEMGLFGGDEYRSYGGHRLWIAPEHKERTYVPENSEVEVAEAGFTTPMDPFGLQKTITITEADGGFHLRHSVRNRGPVVNRFAPWALTVMAPGGECLFPQEPFESHHDNFLPVRPLVLWGYSDMSDPRWTWGQRTVRLRQTTDGPQKVGACVTQGIAVYANHGNVFVKRFEFDPAATYPDYGCNFETFTRHDMLEVESLGALRAVEPGEETVLRESWYLLKGVTPPTEDHAAYEWLMSLAERYRLAQ